MTDLRVLQLASSDEPFFQQQVSALEAAGVDCTTIIVDGQPTGTDSRGIREYARTYRRLLSMSSESYDLIHANYGLVGPLALAQPIRPVVLSLWGSEVMGYSQRLDRLTRAAARRSAGVIVPSHAVSRRLSCEHSVIPFGVDLDVFRPLDREAAREHLGWAQSARVILFPYDPERDVKNVERARRVVSELTTNAELRTVSGRPHDEMPLVMNASDVVLVTSDRESGPMVVREAAACNVPVVSTNVGFVEETLRDIENSYVCETDAELVDGVESALRSAGRSNGRSAVTGLSTERMANHIRSVYATALEEPDPVVDYGPKQSD